MNTYIDKLTFLLKKNENFYKLRYNDVKHIKKFEELLLISIKHSSIEKRIICNKVEENNLFYKYSVIVDNFKLFNSFDWSKYNLKKFKKEDIFLKFINYNNNNKVKNIKYNLNKVLKDNNITQLYVSESLKQFKDRFKKKYNLNDYQFRIKNTLFFGLYNQNDFEILKKHDGKKILILGGSDLENIKKIKNSYNVILLSISKNIYERLSKLKIKSILVDFNLVNKNIFKPITNYGESIYLYDGFTKKNDNVIIYNTNLLNEVKKRLPQFKYIHSSDLNIKHELMNEVYKKCFIGLRLTKNDGNANTVQEFEAMNIPIIHNLSDYGIKWDNIDTIVNIILSKYKELKIDNKLQFQIEEELQLQKEKELQLQTEKELQLQKDSIDFFKTNKLDNNILKLVNNNINNFLNLIHNFKNILLICGDFPGYGGSSTNCSNLSYFLNKNNHNTFSIYFNYPDSNFKKYETNNNYLIDDQNNIDKRIKELKFKPDLIILKSPFHLNLKKYFNCDIYYLVGGIYKNSLNKNYKELKKEENNKFINQSVITQIKLSDKTFVNSSHTCDILLKNYNLKTYIFYSSFVPFIDKKIIIDEYFENRKYEYGLIVSDFSRNIKNIQKSIEFLKNKTKVVLIGKNSNIYKNYGFDCIDLIDKDKMDNYYKQIKYIIQDSFYESCSNVKIESLFNGCQIYNNNIVVCATQYPGYGGASSISYEYHKKLLDEGYNSKLYFFLNEKEIKKVLLKSILYNPSSYNNVYYLLSTNFDNIKEEYYSNFNNASSIIAFNYGIIPKIKKKFTAKLIYYVTGSPELTLGENSPVNNNISYEKFMNEDNYKYLLNNKQAKLNLINLELADKVVVSCEMVKNLYLKFYPQFSNKYTIEPFEKNIYEYKHKLLTNNNSISIDDRKYFIICVSSSWNRPVKNIKLVYNIFKNFPNENKIIIGTQNNKYNFNKIPNTKVLDIISNKDLHIFLANSKNFILPSFFESASITLLEALYNGCNVITSKNVGLSYMIPENNIVNDFENLKSWINIIDYKKCNLFISLDYPGFGGAATNMFEIYNYYKSKYNLLSLLLFITDKEDGLKYNDPDNNIFVTSNQNLNITMELINTKINKNMGIKYFKLNIIYKIYSTIKKVRPYINNYNINKVIYFCSGLKSLQNKKKNHDENDIEPFKTSDICVVNSNVTYNYIKKFYNKEINIINTSIIFKEFYLKKKINNNKFDFIFTTSSYKRIAKNSNLLLQIFSHSRMKNFKKIIIGDDFPISKINNIDNLTYIKLISHNEFISILQQTKMIIIPSINDSMPNVLYEAILNGVTPYISKSIECDIVSEKYFFDIELDIEIIVNNLLNIYNNDNINIDKDFIKKKKDLELNKLNQIFNYIN